MPPSYKMPSQKKPRGATRHRSPGNDRWLNHALDVAVLAALLVGGVALGLNLFLD